MFITCNYYECKQTHPEPKRVIEKADVFSKVDLLEANREVSVLIEGSLLDKSITEAEKTNLKDIENELQLLKCDLQDRIDERGGWMKILYNEDGTVNRNIALGSWSQSEQLLILKEMLRAVITEEENARELLLTLNPKVEKSHISHIPEQPAEAVLERSLSFVTEAIRSSITYVKYHIDTMKKLRESSIDQRRIESPSINVRQHSPLRNIPDGKLTYFGRPVQGNASLFQKIIKDRRMQKAREMASIGTVPDLTQAESSSIFVNGVPLSPMINREPQSEENLACIAEKLSDELLVLCKTLSENETRAVDDDVVSLTHPSETSSFSDVFDKKVGREYSQRLVESLSLEPTPSSPSIITPVGSNDFGTRLTKPGCESFNMFTDAINDDVVPKPSKPTISPISNNSQHHASDEREFEIKMVVPVPIRDFRPKTVNNIDLLMKDFRDRHERSSSKSSSKR